MREIKAICRPERVEHVLEALHGIESLPGVTVSPVEGVGRLRGEGEAPIAFGRSEMAKVEIVVPDALAPRVIDVIEKSATTGHPGDGKIFSSPVDEAVRIRSGERGPGIL